MNALVRRFFLIFGVSMSATAVQAEAISTDGHGILMLFSLKTQKAETQIGKTLEQFGCARHQSGRIGNISGPLSPGSPSHYLLINCQKSLLSTSKRRKFISILGLELDDLRILEGAYFGLQKQVEEQGDISKRNYIVKISRYNNLDLEARERDLAAINKMASQRKDAWKIAYSFMPQRASGIETPDIVDLIYYDSAEQGARFRKNNGDVLAAIGAFNKTHLTSFAYLSLLPE